ncbi:MAG: NAD(P)-dependent oxidoreductase [Minisyncoccia bacterium]
MNIGFFELEGWEEPIIKQHFPNEKLYFYNQKLDININQDFDIVSIFIGSKADSTVLSKFPNLKFITTRSTGFDHIDLNFCKTKNILVSYVPDYGYNTVAEFAFGLILNLTRKIYQAIDRIKEIESFSLDGLRGVDLKGKTIGIIGTGRIGKEMIKIANGFGMNVLGYDKFPDENFASQMNFKYVSLEELLSNSDIISLHCPYNNETHHLINKNNINLIKKGSFLINTARGGLIETDALIYALENKIIIGAGLDVLEEENEIKDELEFLLQENKTLKENEYKTMLEDHVLMKHPNVLITPHNAFNSQEALQRILNTTIYNIQSFIKNNPINLVKF